MLHDYTKLYYIEDANGGKFYTVEYYTDLGLFGADAYGTKRELEEFLGMIIEYYMVNDGMLF